MIADKEENITNNIKPENSILAFSQIDKSNFKIPGSNNLGTSIQAPVLPNTMISGISPSKDLGISVHLRGMSAASYPSVNINSQAPTMISNIGFGAYTHLFKNFQIGFEGGQEPFGLVFTNVDGYNSNLEKRNLQLIWCGLSLRGLNDAKLSYIGYGQPFYQIILGTTEIGPMGKGIVGLQFNPYAGFGFQLGFEGTVLMYKNQGITYWTKKLGITYGMIVNI